MVAHNKQLWTAAPQPSLETRTANHMVDHNLIADLGIDSDQADALIRASLGEDVAEGSMEALISEDLQNYTPGNILKGKVVG